MRRAGTGQSILVFPELCITGYTCADLFWQETLLLAAKESLKQIVEFTKGKKALIFVGLPWEKDGKLYNVAAVICDGSPARLVPKRYLPNYNEFYEKRHFTEGCAEVEWVDAFGSPVPFGMRLLFCCRELPELVAAAELCEDLWAPESTKRWPCTCRGDCACQSFCKRRGDREKCIS